MNQLKITKRLPLPVHLISETGIVDFFANYYDKACSIVGKNQIVFLDYEGKIIETFELKNMNDYFGDRNAVFAYDYEEIPNHPRRLMLCSFKLNEDSKLVYDSFEPESEEDVDTFFWDGVVTLVHFYLEEKGYCFLDYQGEDWEEILCLPTSLWEYYQSKGVEAVDINLAEQYVIFLVEEETQLFIYDYITHTEVREVNLNLEGVMEASYFSKNGKYYVVYERTDYQLNFHVYETQNWGRIATKNDFIEEEIDEQSEKIAFILPHHKIEICSFPELKIIETSDSLPPQLFENPKLMFSKKGTVLIMANDDEVFFLEWSNAIENTQSYWYELTPKLQRFYHQIETWKQENIQSVLTEIQQEDERTQFIIKRELTKRYLELLGEKHLFWK